MTFAKPPILKSDQSSTQNCKNLNEAESKDKVWMTKLTHDLSPIKWSASFTDRPRPINDKQMHKRLQLQEGVLRVPCS